MSTKPTNYFFSLVLIIIFIGCSRDKSVKLIDKNFVEEVTTDQNLNFTFDRPLVGDTLIGFWDETSYIEFEPEIEGRFKWFSESVLVFSPNQKIPPATSYKAILTDKITAPSGLQLAGDRSVGFRTRGLEVERVAAFWSSAKTDETRIYLNLDFNFGISKDEVIKKLSVSVNDKVEKVNLISTDSDKYVEVYLPDIAAEDITYKIDLVLDQGVKPLMGNLPTESPIRKSYTLNSPYSVIVQDILPQHNGVEGTLTVEISQEADTDAKKFISITPKINYELESTESGLKLTSEDFDLRRKYSVIIKKGLKGKYGGSLKTDFTKEISFGQLRPEIKFENENALYLSGRGSKNLQIKIVNVEKVQVTITKLYENNILKFLSTRDYNYDYYTDEYGYDFNYGELSNLGDVVWTQDIDVKELEKKSGYRLLSMNFEDQVKNYEGIYVVRVTSDEKYWLRDSKMVSVSDIGLVAKEGKEQIVVFANSIKTANPLSNIELTFIGRNNQVVGTATTDAEGKASFQKIKKDLSGFNVRMITARQSGDFNFISFSSTSVNTSKFDVGGKRSNLSGFDVFLYGERDIYRPGETMNLSAIIRDEAWQSPGKIPVIFKIKTPDGKNFKTLKKTLNDHGSFEVSVPLSAGALTGSYTAEVYTSNDIFLASKRISVEEFVPDRIKVEMDIDKTEMDIDETAEIKFQALNFFGPPAAGRNYEISISSKRKYFYSRDYSGYNFSLSGTDKYFRNILLDGKTDANGEATNSYELSSEFRNMGLVQSDVFVTVFDETGRPVNRKKTIRISTQDVYYGIGYSSYYIRLNNEISFPLIALDKNGKPLSKARANVSLIKHEYKTVLSKSGGYFRYRSEKIERVVDRQLVDIPEGGLDYTFIPDQPGRYELRVTSENASTYVSNYFYAYGWYGSNTSTSFDVDPEGKIDIEFDKDKYEVGETANIILKTPFSGKVLVTVESDEVLNSFYVETDKRAASFELPIDGAFVPNAYVTATLFKPHEESDLPLTIAHGAAPVYAADPDNKLPLTLNAVEKSRSNTKQKISLQTSPNTAVSIAVVDEGILQLTQFATPDPYSHFYRKRALEVSSYDIYPFLFPEIDLINGRTGGDGSLSGELEKRVNPLTNKRIKLVSFWSGVLESDDDGVIEYEIDIPQFSGDLRIMAAAYKDNSFASASDNMKVADPLVISTGLPRFFSPGDTVIMSVAISNTTDKPAKCDAEVDLTGAISIIGDNSTDVEVAPNSESQLNYTIAVARQIGLASITVNVDGLGESFENLTDITIRPASPLQKLSGSGSVKAGSSEVINIADDQFLPESTYRTLVVSNSPMVEFTKDLDYLVRYPYGCVEQTTSAVFPQLYFQDLTSQILKYSGNKPDPNYFINEGIKKLQLMQLYHGGLTYWPGGGYESWWGSVYAAHFLYEAKAAGFDVDQVMLDKLLNYLVTKLKTRETIFYYFNDTRRRKIAAKEIPYSLYVLALAGKPQRSTMNYYKNNKDVLSLDGKYLLAASYALIGDDKRFREVLPEAFEGEISKRVTGGSFYSYIRDQALALNVLVEADPDNPQIPTMARQLTKSMKARRYLNTQERVFGFLALGKIARRNAGANIKGVIKSGDKKLKDYNNRTTTYSSDEIQSNTIKIETSGEGQVYYFWNSEGITQDGSYREEDSFLKVRKQYYDRNGKPVLNKKFKQNDLIVIKLSLNTLNGANIENVAITDMLPAGFEIENPRITDGPQTNWIRNKSYPDYTDMRDDRISFFVNASGTKRNYYYMVRAVTKGTFQLGPVAADAMYDGEYHSYHGGGVVVVE